MLAEFNMFSFMLSKFFSLLLGLAGIFVGLFVVSFLTRKWNFTDIFEHKTVTNGGIFVASLIIAIGLITAFSVL